MKVISDLPMALRAPVEGRPGTWALGSAMDDLALELGVDSLHLRLENYAEVIPKDARSRRKSCARRTSSAQLSSGGAKRAQRSSRPVLMTSSNSLLTVTLLRSIVELLTM